MPKHALLFLLLVIGSQAQLAPAWPGKKLLSTLKLKVEQVHPNLVYLGSLAVAPFLAVAVLYPVFHSREKLTRELEYKYRQREVFTQALARGEREVITAQLELDNFALERYIGLTIHYVQNNQHRIGTVVSVDSLNNNLHLAGSNALVSHTEIEGVLILDHHVQGRIAIFYTRDAHLLDASKKHLFAERTSAFGTVAGVTNRGYLLVRPYVNTDDDSATKEAFTSLLYIVHEDDLPMH